VTPPDAAVVPQVMIGIIFVDPDSKNSFSFHRTAKVHS
jgi:hypothetical protein